MATPKKRTKVDRRDVFIAPVLDPRCIICNDMGTRRVVIDLPDCEFAAFAGSFCDRCVEYAVKRVRAALPPKK